MHSHSTRVLMLLGSYDTLAHQGIAQAAKELGWHLDINLQKTFQLPRQCNADGILCSLNRSQQLAHFVTNAHVPTVDLSIWRSELKFPRVIADNEAIGETAASHLLAYGHRHFAAFTSTSNPVSKARLKAFGKKLEPLHLEVTRIENRSNLPPGHLEKQLLTLPKPCGVFCYNDVDAGFLLNLALENGIAVPQELAILGVDNNPLICEIQPIPLSSVNHDLKRVGYEGALMLDKLMKNEPLESKTKLIAPNGVTTRASTDALAVADKRIHQALVYMRNNLAMHFGTNDIAEAIGMSRRNLEICFRKATHCSINQKLRGMRLEQAKNMLLNTDHGVEDISAMCGFANAPHLCREFKKRYNHPPHKYRKTAGKH